MASFVASGIDSIEEAPMVLFHLADFEWVLFVASLIGPNLMLM
jgi:hypothetical protein